jgi:hypothetical protein
MAELTQSLNDRKDKVIGELTVRVIELEDELADAWNAVHHYELGESRLIDRCLEIEGRDRDADNIVRVLEVAHPRQ